jgi:hypothetical protein
MRRRLRRVRLWVLPVSGANRTEEVVRVPAEKPTENERRSQERVPDVIESGGKDPLRALAIERIHRKRRFKLHISAFALGLPLLGGLWVLTEYYEENTWPSRFASDPDVAGTWDPWFFFVAGIWFVILVVHALRTYFGPPIGPVGRYIRRPIDQAEIDREVERLTRHQRGSSSPPASLASTRR